jgi:putative ABC transport system permease protein
MRRPDPLWLRSPLVLLRFPALFGALTLGTLLLCAAAVVLPLFVSATTSELLTKQIEEPTVTRYGAGVLFRSQQLPFRVTVPNGREPMYDAMATAFGSAVAEDPAYGAPISSVLGPVVTISGEGVDDPLLVRPARIFAGSAAAEHLQIVAGDADSGVLLPDLIGDALHLGPGDRIDVSGSGRRRTVLTIGGIYRSLYSLPNSPYWDQWAGSIYNPCTNCAPFPQFLVMDRDDAVRLSQQLGAHNATFSLAAPLATSHLTLEQATDAAEFARRLKLELESDPVVGPAFGLRVEVNRYLAPQPAAYESALPEVIADVHARVDSIEQPGRVLRAAGLLVAALVVAAAGLFAWGARRTEHDLMLARGMSPSGVAARAALEALPPCLLGWALGFGLAALLVAGPGPDGAVASDAWPRALTASLLALGGGLTLLVVITVAAYLRPRGRRSGAGRVLAWVPWEAPLLIGGLAALNRLRNVGALGAVGTAGSSSVSRPSLLLLAAPILLLAGASIVGARLVRAGALALRSRRSRYGPATFLAVRRLAGAPLLTAALFAAAGMCLGVFVESSTLVRSLETTVEAKAKIYVGSDAQARIDPNTQIIRAPEVPFTRVKRLPTAGTFAGGTEPFDLLVIDPATFAGAAYWNDALSEEPLPTLLARLDDGAAGALPAIVVAGTGTPTSITVQQRDLTVDVVGTAVAFPGMISRRPMLVVSRAQLEATFGEGGPLVGSIATEELWGRGDGAAAAFEDMEPVPFLVISAAEVEDIPSIAAVVNTFTALNAVGLAAAVLVIGGLLMYLQSRQRSQLVAYGISLRMGMTDRAHRRSLSIELLSTLLGALAIGTAVAVAVAAFVVPLLDPLAAIPPDPLFVPPARTLVATTLIVAAVAWIGSWVTNLRARRTPMGEVMRVA